MFLKKLEISGFKSFANKTTLDFSGSQGDAKGVTAVVGPNGSGKSNIADSMRWVMGEQSMKNLRGKKSEDIIFAGSGKKARLGSAYATLFFDNSDKKIPLEFDEVSITRKIFRSGEGEYQINGSRVRLQDVVDLLAKTGIGKESYAIINQGMADAILNAAPLERRSIIEEAAGVKQYQIKKERALRKLESTRDNLDKARSLAEEIKPHLKMLKRQAEKATQGEGVRAELKDKQTKLFTYLWSNFQQEKIKFNEAKEDMGRTMLNVKRDVDKLTDEINKESKEGTANNNLPELEKKRSEARNRLNQLERDLIVNEGRIEIEREKQKNIEMIEEIRTKSIPVDLHYVRAGIEEIRRNQENLIKQLESAENMDDLQDIKEFARSIQQRLFELKQDIEKGKKEETVETHRNASVLVEKPKVVETVDSQVIQELIAKAAQLRADIQKMEMEIQQIEAAILAETSADRERRQKFFEVERNLRAKQDELNKLKDNFNDSKIALAKVEVHEEDLRAEVLQDLKIDPSELKPILDEQGNLIAVDRIALDRDISRLKVQMEQIGGIDPLVVEEFEETNKRYEFLTKESADLEAAIVSLKEIIKEMNQKVNEVFATTFDEIDKEFTKYFRIIFGGGNASLKKVEVRKRSYKSKEEGVEGTEGAEETDEAEALETEEEKKEKSETGIDIFASPPGKKISNLSMLSGGERSLTSLALLFAIISHNPPPFAVLDEVEAALDEANSRRFGRIIQELSGNTQFIIITHNRETMRQASTMYGITMGEDGISKLLSVRLDQVGQGGKILQ
ncbi:MAG: AAA family ATPase [Parcubacteria group bacterium]|jgi:chromosome segregation protein